MSPLSLRQLRVFRAVMQSGSVTGAARQLRIAQPAVSKCLRETEAMTGVPLFSRSRGRLFPTAEAEILLEEVERLLGHHELVAERIAELRDAKQGRLIVAAIPTLAGSIIAEALGRFGKGRPRVQLRVEAHATRRVVDLVARQEVDLGFVHGPVSEPGVRSASVCQSRIVCVMPPEHPLTRLDEVKATDLIGQPLISFGADSPPGWVLKDIFQSIRAEPPSMIETNHSVAACAMVHAGLGVALIDPFVVLGSAFARMPARPFQPAIKVRATALSSSYRPMSRLATEFLANLRQIVGEQARRSTFIAVIH